MKKLGLLFAAAVMAVSASAQTVQESKTFDNIYVGINGGVATKTKGHAWMKGLDPNAGLRIGRWFTPVFGLAVEGNAYFSNKPWVSTGTIVRFVNTSLLGTVNLSNWFGGYKGQPRPFEVIAVAGLGWGHLFGNDANYKATTYHNNLTNKLAFDFAFNFGADKAWQFYVEPAIIYGLNDRTDVVSRNLANDGLEYNANHSFVQLNAGLVYKFKTSNGTHNFKIVTPRDQNEIDALNSQISDLRDQLAKKPKEVVREVVKEVPAAGNGEINPLFVTFAQGKSYLTSEAKKVLDGVAQGSKVQIIGTASPEGSSSLNKKLSQDRANVVANYLKNKGVTVEKADGKGVQGATSNRLAVVFVK